MVDSTVSVSSTTNRCERRARAGYPSDEPDIRHKTPETFRKRVMSEGLRRGSGGGQEGVKRGPGGGQEARVLSGCANPEMRTIHNKRHDM
eukprot:5923650-Pyramimonas_sp.AAC.2